MDDILLSWRLEDVCNQDLYTNEVKEIPTEFHSVGEYLNAYTLPLIEETRAELFSSLENISEAPCAEIRHVALEHTKRGPVCSMDVLADGFSGGTDVYEPKIGDVFVLSSLKPGTIDDLLRYGVIYCLAVVKKVMEFESDEALVTQFKMSVSPTVTEDELQGCTHALYLTNIVTNSRIWRALQCSGVDQNFMLLKKVLSANQMEENMRGSIHEENPEVTRVLEQIQLVGLNQSQVEVVESTISAVQCDKLSSTELVWGPPGTGKTKTVASILWSLKQLKFRTLTCAPTNVAVVGVCSRLVHMVKNSVRNNGDSNAPPISLADVVLFGNRRRMDVVGDLEDVFLDNRINQLENCFLSNTSWRRSVDSMVCLLEDYVSVYRAYVEKCKEDQKASLSFGDYLREQYNKLEKNVSSRFRTMLVHIPRRFLSSENCTSILSLLELLRELGELLSGSVITDEQLKQTFESPPSLVFSVQKKLVDYRGECLKQLQNLQENVTLSISSLTNGCSIKDFCIQNATLVFCTASTSFLLHDAQTSCFNVVVIDEAAQLKECESVIPLTLNHVKHAVLVGDERQLPALVQSRVNKRAGFGKSLFQRLVSLRHEKHLLNIQYRMHPSISLFPNNRFYDGKILDGSNVLEDGYNDQYLNLLFGSYAFLNIADGREESDDGGKSLRNWVEVAVVEHLIKTIYESWESTKGKLSVGIISPYAAQVKAIRDRIGKKYDNDAEFDVRVKSIDGFQGQEDDIIILSTVRCNPKGNVGFLYDNQRTNVAITRARHCLWIVGSATTLLGSGTVWSDIVSDAEQRGCLSDAKDVKDIGNLILNVKNTLDQLVDLLNPDSLLFSSTRWKVIFSDEFLRSFTRLKSKTTRMGLVHMVLKLAGGWRSKKRNLSMSNRSFCLARVYAVAGHYLVWSIDLQKDQIAYTQIIKLWNFISLSDVEGLLKRMDYIFSMYTDAYIERCKTICLEGAIEVPMMWTDGHEIAQYRKNNPHEITGENQDISDTNSSFLEDSQVNESLILMRFYALSSNVVKHLLTACDGSEIDIPFELDDQEMEIIRFPYSSFILGRSGTGKTTILTTKLVRMEQQFFVASHGLSSSDGGPSVVIERVHGDEQMDENNEVGFLKQVFLTVSPKLCSAVRGQVNRLVRFANFGELSGPIDSLIIHDGIDTLDEFTDIPDSFCDLTSEHYPLIITFRKFLMMLDGTIGSSFFNKFYSDWGASMKQGSMSRTLQSLIQSKEVNFDKFYGSYWPRFNEQLTKNLDAATVFTQIISHIKGVCDSVKGAASSRDQYVALSEKRSSSLSSAVRDRIYDIFLEYEKKKRAAKEFDLSDFVNNLHGRLKIDSCQNFKVDFVYIDEVQDLTVSQIALLKYVCNNFKEGYVFAGDTAQTIARGIDFRFEDIRSLFYTEFLSMLKGKEKVTHLSDMFQLCQNFRTHIGVLKLAQSVIDLLYYFFPFSIDKLDPETSLIYGDAPVLLESGGDENAISKIFRGSENSGRRLTEFGAEQVILVRDDSAKKEILEIVGKRALVLTIIDCKGLEFQDVLLYNFFGSSPLENKWRVLYEYLENEDILDPSMTRSYPRFDITNHYLLCSELKQLYVAITRTRQRLWICENSKEFCMPMFHFWKRLCLVQGTQLDTDFVEAIRTASTPEEWRVRGIKLFNEKQFEMARMCFEKAGDVYNGNWARAAGLAEIAERHSFTNLEKAHTALQKAADIYEAIRMFDKAATCYIKLGNYAKAGTIYVEKCGTSRLEDAADCFDMIKCWSRAADLYFQANCFAKCASSCLKGELFVRGLEYLDKWRLEEERSTNKSKFAGLEATREEYLWNCAIFLHQRGDVKNMMHFVKAFKSMVEARKFLKSKACLDELLKLELEAGNFVEAAGIAQSRGDRLLEADIWEKAGSFEKATHLVVLDVIVETLWSHGSKGWPPKSFPKCEGHSKKAKNIANKVSTCFYNSVCSELRLWDDKPKTFSMLSKVLVEAMSSKNTRLTFLSLRCLLDLHLNHENSQYLLEAELPVDLKEWCHERNARGRLSLNTLICVWARWQETAIEVSTSPCQEFCIDYLGVRKEDGNGYCVLNPNAWWIGDGVRALLKKSRTGKYNLMTSNLYTSSAASYWRSEILSVGETVVAKLDSLLRFSGNQALPLETKGRISLSVYEVLKSLKQISSSKDDSNSQKNISSVGEWFWNAIFPVDSKNSSIQGVLSIIDCSAAIELVDEFLEVIPGRKNGKFTYQLSGKVSMILLLSGKLPDNWFGKIEQFTEHMPEWQDFFTSLRDLFIGSCERISMVVNFQKALQATYEVDWGRERDYISPHCYLYLLELLTFFTSYCLGSVSYMITTRSVLAEIMKLKGCRIFLDSPIGQMAGETGTSTSLQRLFEFIVRAVRELLSDKGAISTWINKCSHSHPGNFYRQMVLRLAITLHMAYLNMSRDFYSAGKFLSSCYDISRDLPRQFASKIHQFMCSRERNTCLVAFVEAFASVGDPLVVVSKKKDNYVFPPSNFFFFCCDEMRDRDHVMSILFPGSVGPDVAPSMVSCADLSSSTGASDLTSGTKDSQGKMEDKLVKILEAFQRCEKNDVRVTIDILGALHSWLQRSKPPKGFYDLLVEEIRGVYDHFVKTTCLSEGKYTYISLKSLFSYWKDGEAKLNLIIDTLVSNKMSNEASDSNTGGAATPEKSEITAPAVAEKKDVEAREGQEDTRKEPLWDVLEAFQLKSYLKEDVKAIANLLLAAHSLLEEKKSSISFDEQLIEEMKSVYNSILDLVARGGKPTLEDLYSQWPHGEIKLKLVVDTLLLAYHERRFDDDAKEVSESRPDKEKLAKEKAVVKMDAGPSNPQKLNNQKTNKKPKKKGKKNRH